MDLRQATMRGLVWSFLSQGGGQGCQFVILAILARLLSPEAFGLWVMANIFIEFFNIVVEMGTGAALIQKHEATREHYDSVFWLNAGFGVFLTVVMMAASPLITKFYGRPDLQPVLMAFSLNCALMPFIVVQQAILTKGMRFKELAARDIGATLCAGLGGVIMASQGFGIWSLVTLTLGFSCFNIIFLWVLSSWRPRFYFSLERIREISLFGTHLTGFNLLNYAARNVDKLLIGRFLGAEALGYYSLAYRVVIFPLHNISWSIGRVMFPVLSKIQDDLGRVGGIYLRMVARIAFVVFPLMTGLLVAAPEIVKIFLGERWSPMILLLQIFAVCGIFQAIGTTVGNIYMSQGQVVRQFRLQIFGTLMVISSVVAGLRWGLPAVACFYTLQSIVWVVLNLWVISRLLKIRFTLFWDFFKPYVLMATAILPLVFLTWNGMMPWSLFLVKIIFTGIIFLAGGLLTKDISCDRWRILIKTFQK